MVQLYQYLVEKKKEFVLSKQILRSGTSIGANVEEAIGISAGGLMLAPDYSFSMTMHLAQNAVWEVQDKCFWPAVGDAAVADLKQTAVETAAFPLLGPGPITTTVSFFRHLRHWFLQE